MSSVLASSMLLLHLLPFIPLHAPSSTSSIVSFATVVSDLTPGFAPSVLPSFGESRVQFDFNLSAFDFGTVQQFDGFSGGAMGEEFHETKPTRHFVYAIQPHHDGFDYATRRKSGVYL